LALLSPIVATVLGTLVAGEAFTPIQALGFTITLGALVLGQVFARQARLVAPPAEPAAAPALVAPR
ncbi:hypothetical protein, partial [Bacillus sp. SIMBA_005]|uniref:hypothetical protein n=1 Tax=Bacillus sp. SIMBA_005 TaxID=3085754 RepID=UPI00397C4F65